MMIVASYLRFMFPLVFLSYLNLLQTKVLRCCKLTRLNVAVGTVVLIIVLLVYTNCFSLWGGVVRSQGSAEGAAAGGVVSPDGLHTPPRDFTYLHLRNSSNSSRGPGGEDFLFDDGRVSDNGKIRCDGGVVRIH